MVSSETIKDSAENTDTAADRARSPFTPIANYGFLSDCHTARSSHPTGRSTGCAFRASTRRACSARSRRAG
jgi:hypothetical protein